MPLLVHGGRAGRRMGALGTAAARIAAGRSGGEGRRRQEHRRAPRSRFVPGADGESCPDGGCGRRDRSAIRSPIAARRFDRAADRLATCRAGRGGAWAAGPPRLGGGAEYSFNHNGDRGSVDVLAWHRDARALLIVEAKSDLRNVQETLHTLDIKRRVVPGLARADRGWRTESLGVVMVLSDLRVERERVDRHAATFNAALPARTVAVRRWLENPVGSLGGVWFLQIARQMGATREPAGNGRIRRPRIGSGADAAGPGSGFWRSQTAPTGQTGRAISPHGRPNENPTTGGGPESE